MFAERLLAALLCEAAERRGETHAAPRRPYS